MSSSKQRRVKALEALQGLAGGRALRQYLERMSDEELLNRAWELTQQVYEEWKARGCPQDDHKAIGLLRQGFEVQGQRTHPEDPFHLFPPELKEANEWPV